MNQDFCGRVFNFTSSFIEIRLGVACNRWSFSFLLQLLIMVLILCLGRKHANWWLKLVAVKFAVIYSTLNVAIGGADNDAFLFLSKLSISLYAMIIMFEELSIIKQHRCRVRCRSLFVVGLSASVAVLAFTSSVLSHLSVLFNTVTGPRLEQLLASGAVLLFVLSSLTKKRRPLNELLEDIMSEIDNNTYFEVEVVGPILEILDRRKVELLSSKSILKNKIAFMNKLNKRKLTLVAAATMFPDHRNYEFQECIDHFNDQMDKIMDAKDKEELNRWSRQTADIEKNADQLMMTLQAMPSNYPRMNYPC